VSKTYTACEVAEAIGITPDTLRRTRQWRQREDMMPAPISERGRLKWERTGFDTWLRRYHPLARSPANDAAVMPDSRSIEDQRRQLAAEYGNA